MKWPWVRRKEHEGMLAELAEAKKENTARLKLASDRFLEMNCVKGELEKEKHKLTASLGVVGVLRAELAAKKQDIAILMQKTADKDAVIEAQKKEIERLQKNLPQALNTRRKHFHGAGGIREQLEAEAANEKKSTLPEGAN